MYDMYECNVGYKNVNYSRKVIVLYSAYDRSNIIAVFVVNMNATILVTHGDALGFEVISSRTVKRALFYGGESERLRRDRFTNFVTTWILMQSTRSRMSPLTSIDKSPAMKVSRDLSLVSNPI